MQQSVSRLQGVCNANSRASASKSFAPLMSRSIAISRNAQR
ncbi:MAG: hypothetical protein Q8P67_24480 [archaeon]|nr:hypothetical protein [archaeon]